MIDTSAYRKKQIVTRQVGIMETPMNKEGVAFSKIAHVIHLYTLNERKWKKKADKTLHKILNDINPSISVCMTDGLCGLGCGLMYLLRNGFVKGDEDIILEDIDYAVQTAIMDNYHKDISWAHGLCGWFTYIVLRLEKASNPLKKQYIYNKNSLSLLLGIFHNIRVENDFDKKKLMEGLRKLSQAEILLPQVKSLLNKYRACGSDINENKKINPSVYAVIVLYNGMQWYDKCFKSLEESIHPVHIVAIDNASGDETITYILSKYPDVLIIESKTNIGFAGACNMGIDYALKQDADYVFLLNQDAWIQKDTITVLLNTFFKNPDAGIVSSIHLNGDGTAIDDTFNNYCPKSFINDAYFGKMKDEYKVSFVNAAAWLLNCECLKVTGYFNTTLFTHYGEDNNFCQRILYHGYAIYINTKTHIYHDRANRPHQYKQSMFTKENEFLAEKISLGDINVYHDINKYIFETKKSILWNLTLLRFNKIIYLKRYLAMLKSVRESRILNAKRVRLSTN
ncbi:MAG TPA: hypothetical protein DEQ30_00955 [Porphyromonadaceae bacterium]|nr:hypothetical protein [Porphyromonadaceae bacterium]